MTDSINKGWKLLMNAPKAHYFVDGHSLCGKWMFFGEDGLEDFGHDHPDNCKACMKKHEKLAATKINEGL